MSQLVIFGLAFGYGVCAFLAYAVSMYALQASGESFKFALTCSIITGLLGPIGLFTAAVGSFVYQGTIAFETWRYVPPTLSKSFWLCGTCLFGYDETLSMECPDCGKTTPVHWPHVSADMDAFPSVAQRIADEAQTLVTHRQSRERELTALDSLLEGRQ